MGRDVWGRPEKMGFFKINKSFEKKTKKRCIKQSFYDKRNLDMKEFFIAGIWVACIIIIFTLNEILDVLIEILGVLVQSA